MTVSELPKVGREGAVAARAMEGTGPVGALPTLPAAGANQVFLHLQHTECMWGMCLLGFFHTENKIKQNKTLCPQCVF